MKSAELYYSRNFPETPISIWADFRWRGWVKETTASGQRKRPAQIDHPFRFQRKLWCLLHVHFRGVDLIFATPAELDQFLDVISRNPMPSGYSLLPGQKIGRPSRHWLSRLPKEAKSWKFRQAVCRFLRENKVVGKFRDFYADQPLKEEFEGVYNSYSMAAREDETSFQRP